VLEESEVGGTAPVFGAPLGTTETWPEDGARVGAALGTALGAVEALGLALGAEVGAWVAVGTGLGVAFVPSANAGSAPASTAVHASAMALRPVRRMNRSPSSVRPVVDRRAV